MEGSGAPFWSTARGSNGPQVLPASWLWGLEQKGPACL